MVIEDINTYSNFKIYFKVQNFRLTTRPRWNTLLRLLTANTILKNIDNCFYINSWFMFTKRDTQVFQFVIIYVQKNSLKIPNGVTRSRLFFYFFYFMLHWHCNASRHPDYEYVSCVILYLVFPMLKQNS